MIIFPSLSSQASGQTPKTKKQQNRTAPASGGKKASESAKKNKKQTEACEEETAATSSTNSTPKKSANTSSQSKKNTSTPPAAKPDSPACVKRAKTARDNNRDLGLCRCRPLSLHVVSKVCFSWFTCSCCPQDSIGRTRTSSGRLAVPHTRQPEICPGIQESHQKAHGLLHHPRETRQQSVSVFCLHENVPRARLTLSSALQVSELGDVHHRRQPGVRQLREVQRGQLGHRPGRTQHAEVLREEVDGTSEADQLIRRERRARVSSRCRSFSLRKSRTTCPLPVNTSSALVIFTLIWLILE